MVEILRFVSRNIVALLLIIAALGVGGYLGGGVQSVRAFFFPNLVQIESSRTIVLGLQGMGQLVSIKAEVHTTDVRVSVNRGFLNAGYYSASHKAYGAIEAGINFDEINSERVRFDNDAYTIQLPAPIITSCRIEHIDQYGHSFTLTNADWDMVRQLAQYDAIEQFVSDMREAGILDRAREKVEEHIGSFVSMLTSKRVNMQFDEIDQDQPLPDSCTAEEPEGWEKDENGAWSRE